MTSHTQTTTRKIVGMALACVAIQTLLFALFGSLTFAEWLVISIFGMICYAVLIPHFISMERRGIKKQE